MRGQLNKGRPPAAAAKASSTPEGLSAPLFHSLMQRLQTGGRWVVLDLGAAHSATIRALGRFRCRLEIVELADGLDALNGEIDPRRIRQRADALLPRRGEATDVVLCWDLINYLNQPALTAVMECIALALQARCARSRARLLLGENNAGAAEHVLAHRRPTHRATAATGA